MQSRKRLRIIAIALAGAITFGASLAAIGDDKRPLPDYDGRGNPDADAESWALWIPRAVLAPVYLIHEYGVRRPLGAAIVHAEREQWTRAIHDFFTFGPDRSYLWFPTAFYDFGFLPSVGVHVAGTGVLADGNDLSLHAATGGRDWIVASLRDRYHWNAGKTSLATHFDLSRRPDHTFTGIGPDARKADRARYGLQRLEAGSSLVHATGDARLEVSAGARRIDFRPARCCGDPELADQVRDQMIEAPPGFDTPYTALYQRVALTLDSRPLRPAPGNGARLAIYGESDFDLGNDRRWTRYGASLAGALDLNGHHRTLTLTLAADFVDPFASDTVPFTELAALGGDTMQGFGAGAMLGRSTVMAELAYAWPVWFAMDGSARLSVGNAFGEQLAGFAPDKLRISGDIGVATVGSRDHRFEVLVGLGTETLDQGGRINSVRFAFGSKRGI